MTQDSSLIVKVPKELAEVVNGFMARRNKDIGDLRAALTEHNYIKIKDIGHKLKGNSAGYGFDYMSYVGAEIEKEAKASNDVALASLIDQLEVYLKTVQIEIAK